MPILIEWAFFCFNMLLFNYLQTCLMRLSHKNKLHSCNKSNKSNKGNQYPNTSFVIFLVKFKIFTVGVNHDKNERDCESNSEGYLTTSKHKSIFYTVYTGLQSYKTQAIFV